MHIHIIQIVQHFAANSAVIMQSNCLLAFILCRMESLTLLAELYSLAYPDGLSTPHVDMSDGGTVAPSEPEDSEEHRQTSLEAFMKHHGIEGCLDMTQNSASN